MTRTIEKDFSDHLTSDELYKKIIQWGKRLPPFQPEWKVDANRVSGCQSVMYLHTIFQDERVYFSATSDALISAGLAAILIEFYNGHPPEMILKTPPHFLDKLGIPGSLTPGRANGLTSLYLKMKQEALKLLLP